MKYCTAAKLREGVSSTVLWPELEQSQQRRSSTIMITHIKFLISGAL